MYAGGERRANGGSGDGVRDALLQRRRQPGPSSPSSGAAAAASSSSSGRGEEGEEEGGGAGRRQGRRKKQGKREAVARAIRDGLPAAAASCWRGVSVVQETGGRTARSRRRESLADGSEHGGGDAGEGGPGPGAGTGTAAWCCVCPGGDCSLQANPSANGKEDPGLRSFLESNDFFAADCNPHADGLPATASSW